MKFSVNLSSIKQSFVKNKVFLILIFSLVGVQFFTSTLQLINNRSVAIETLGQDLLTGQRVVYEILSYRNQQLNQTAEILAKDYGFQETFLSSKDDIETMKSVLENHLQRANAELIVLSDMSHHVMAQMPENLTIPKDTNLTLFRNDLTASKNIILSTVTEQNGLQQRLRLFHLVRSPLKAPNHVANLIMGYEMNYAFLAHMREMANLELVMASQINGQWVLNASTIPNLALSDIASQLNTPSSPNQPDHPELVKINNEEFLITASAIKQVDSECIVLLIAKPLAQALKPFNQIENIQYALLVLSIFVSCCAIFFVTKRIFNPLNQQAHTDPLTGVGNRRHFEMMLEKAIQDHKREQTPFVIMLFDLNKFKQINDEKGHEVGDFVLKIVAQRIQHIIRSYDCVFRLGGDEFAVLIQHCRQEVAIRVADELWKSINAPMSFNADKFSISTSIGIAQYRENDTVSALVKRADDAMYHSKVANLNFVYR